MSAKVLVERMELVRHLVDEAQRLAPGRIAFYWSRPCQVGSLFWHMRSGIRSVQEAGRDIVSLSVSEACPAVTKALSLSPTGRTPARWGLCSGTCGQASNLPRWPEEMQCLSSSLWGLPCCHKGPLACCHMGCALQGVQMWPAALLSPAL